MSIKKITILLLISLLLLSLGCVEEKTDQAPEARTSTQAITPTPTPPAALSPTPAVTGTPSSATPTITITPKSSNLSAGKNILVDSGERERGSRVLSYLKNQGITEIDLMVATHPHSDHIGGLITILNEFRVKHGFSQTV